MTTFEVAGPAAARAVLTDPRFVVPSVPGDDPAAGRLGGLAWLRATVARFSTGAAHQRRRALAVAALDGVRPAELRRSAQQRTASWLAAAAGPVDLMTEVARVVPVELLAAALGFSAGPALPVDVPVYVPVDVPFDVPVDGPADVAADVAVLARAYHPHVDPDPASERAVRRLVQAGGALPDEATAARIGLLVQACDATAGLVGNAAFAMLSGKLSGDAGAVLAETLHRNPAVRATRRVAARRARVGSAVLAAGTVLRVELAGELAFGAGPHTCPGREHALAIAAGILDALRSGELVRPDIDYEPSPHLRVPRRLEIARPGAA